MLKELECLGITKVYTYLNKFAAKSPMFIMRYTTTRNKTVSKQKDKYQ